MCKKCHEVKKRLRNKGEKVHFLPQSSTLELNNQQPTLIVTGTYIIRTNSKGAKLKKASSFHQNDH